MEYRSTFPPPLSPRLCDSTRVNPRHVPAPKTPARGHKTQFFLFFWTGVFPCRLHRRDYAAASGSGLARSPAMHPRFTHETGTIRNEPVPDLPHSWLCIQEYFPAASIAEIMRQHQVQGWPDHQRCIHGLPMKPEQFGMNPYLIYLTPGCVYRNTSPPPPSPRLWAASGLGLARSPAMYPRFTHETGTIRNEPVPNPPHSSCFVYRNTSPPPPSG